MLADLLCVYWGPSVLGPMISLDQLRNLRHIIAHVNCADGVASALILKDALPGADVRFVQYNTTDHITLPAVEGMVFCDFSPHLSRVNEFLEVGAIVLDHHGGPAEEVTQAFMDKGLGSFSKDPGISGAWLAFEHIWQPLFEASLRNGPSEETGKHLDIIRDLARSAGIYDTWQNQDPAWQQAVEDKNALLFCPWDTLETTPYTLWQDRVLALGPMLAKRNLRNVQKCIKDAHSFTTAKGTKVLFFEGTKPSSDATELVTGYDLIIGSAFLVDSGQPKMIFSTRSRSDFNCRALALAHGGGGHLKAAGFAWNLRPGDPNPYSLVEMILERYESVESSWLRIIEEPNFDKGVASGAINPFELYQNLVLNKSFQTLTPPKP